MARHLPNRWLVGWSFGADLALRHGPDPELRGVICLSPPLHLPGEPDLVRWRESGQPLLVLVPEHDDYLRPAQARQAFAAVPNATVIGVAGAKHLWIGEPNVRRVLDEIVSMVEPAVTTPLPTTYPEEVR